MKNRHIWIWSFAGLIFLCSACFAAPLIRNACRPVPAPFSITTVSKHPFTESEAFEFSDRTRLFVVSEGPCGGDGCQGGIIPGRDDSASSTLWLYQIEPVRVQRKLDPFGEDTITISGKPAKKKTFYFAQVPRKLVEPPLQWIFVETK